MNDHTTYENSEDRFGPWIAVALLASLVLHVVFMLAAERYKVPSMSPSYYDEIVPRSVHLVQAEIDPRTLDPETPIETTPIPTTPLPAPDDTVQSADSTLVTQPLTPTKNPIPLPDDPTLDPTDTTPTDITAGLPTTTDIIDKPIPIPIVADSSTKTPSDPTTGLPTSSSALDAGRKFSDLSTLLAQKGKLTDKTAPILMPGDLLFAFNSDQLHPESLTELAKLAELIRRNPQAIFTIEGHTDSIGGEAFNLDLSKRRALNVCTWLTENCQIPSTLTRAIGCGSTRLITPATGDPETEKRNRRVEILIKTPKNL